MNNVPELQLRKRLAQEWDPLRPPASACWRLQHERQEVGVRQRLHELLLSRNHARRIGSGLAADSDSPRLSAVSGAPKSVPVR
jgi:hypothetical protein